MTRLRDERPQHDVGHCPQQGIGKAARVESWLDAGQTRAACLKDFLGHLGDAQHDRVDEAVGRQEEAEVAAAAAETLARVAHRAQASGTSAQRRPSTGCRCSRRHCSAVPCGRHRSGVARAASASAARFETKSDFVSLSNQRKAGMLSLSPKRMPAWLALVWLGSRVVHGASRIRPRLTQRDMIGTRPAWICCWRTGYDRPSIWMKTKPGFLRADRVASACQKPAHEHRVVRVVRVETQQPAQDRVDDGKDDRGEDGVDGL